MPIEIYAVRKRALRISEIPMLTEFANIRVLAHSASSSNVPVDVGQKIGRNVNIEAHGGAQVNHVMPLDNITNEGAAWCHE
jgi:hypothetical protein